MTVAALKKLVQIFSYSRVMVHCLFAISFLFLVSCGGGSESTVTMAPLPILSVGDSQGTEGDAILFRVTISRVHDENVEFEWKAIAEGSTQSSDILPSEGRGIIVAGQTEVFLEVQTVDDNIPESSETFSLALSNPVNAKLSLEAAVAIGTIIDNENEPALSIDDITVNEGGTATFTVTASESSEQVMRFDWSITHIGTQNSDFLQLSGTGLEIPVGETTKAFTVPLKDDSIDEYDESFQVVIKNPHGAILADDIGVGTIIDNDGPPSLFISDYSVEEGGDLKLTVSLNRASEKSITFDWTTVDGTAISPDDYSASSATGVTIAPGITAVDLTVVSVDDLKDESNETFSVQISNATNANIADNVGVATLVDNDSPPTLSIDDVTVTEGGVANLTVSLNAASEQDVSFDFTTSNASAQAPGDYTPTTGTLTISSGSLSRTVQVTTIDDTLFENQETIEVVIFNSTNASIIKGTGVITLQDNDTSPALSVNDITVTEGATASFTVSVSAAAGKDIHFNWATASNTAQSGEDFVASAATDRTIPAGTSSVTIDIATLDDGLDESSEDFHLIISDPVNATISTGTGVATITDNDPTPSLSISDVTVTEGGTAIVSVSLDSVSGRDVTFDWATANGTATSGTGDFTADAGTKTIPKGSSSVDIAVTTLDDVKDEITEEFAINISNATNANISDATGLVTINDNDPLPALSISNVTVEEGDTAVFTVSLNAVSEKDVSFDWSAADGSAKSPQDYTFGSANGVTIAAGSTSTTISVGTNEDAINEVSENFSVTLSNPVNATVSSATGTATITDNEPLPVVSVNDVTVTEGGLATFTVTLNAASGLDVNLDWQAVDDTATAPTDYIAASGSMTIAAGSVSQTFSVNTIQDVVYETGETFKVILSNPVNAQIGDGEGLGSITNDDPAPTLSIDDVTATEGGAFTFTITLTGSSDVDAQVDWATASNTATAGSDFTSNSNTITIPAGSTTRTITVNSIDDSIDELNEEFLVNLSNPSHATLTDNQGSGTIQDNDSPPVLSINDVTVTEGGTATFTLSIDQVSGLAVTADWATANNTAIAPGDFTANSGSITIPAGATSTTISVTTLADGIAENIESFYVNLSNVGNATLGDAVGEGSISDDNSLPTLSVDDITIAEGGVATFTVSLSQASGQDVRFDWVTSNNTAVAGADYNSNSGTDVVIPKGDTSVTISTTTIDDALDENNETFFVTISAPENATIADPTGQATITDNDPTPSLSINDVTVVEGGAATLTVTLDAASGRDVQVDWQTVDDSAVSASDFTAGSGTLTIPAGSTFKSITVNTTQDTTNEAVEAFEVQLSNPISAVVSGATGVVTIQDNDSVPALAIDDVSVTEGNAATFTVTLSAVSEQDVTFDWTTVDGSAVSTEDYSANSGSGVTILAGSLSKTLTVNTTDDTLKENIENFTVVISNANNSTISDSVGVATLNDNDAVPTLSISSVAITEGDTAQFTVTLSAVSGRAVTFDWATSDGTAIAGSDYSSGSGIGVSIPPGNTSVTVSVVSLQDALDEDSETFSVQLTNPVGATIDTGTGVATISDEDSTPTLSINDVTVVEGSAVSFTATLSAVSGRNISFDWATADGTAVAGSDYTAGSGTETIVAGSLSKVITVQSLEDLANENAETFTVGLSNPVNVTLADATGVGTLTDNDSVPTLSISDVTVTEGSSAVFTVNLSAPAGRNVTFDWTTADGSATSGSDFTADSGTVTISEGSTSAIISVATTDDAIDEEVEDFTVQLTNPSNATFSDATGVATLNDNDAAPSLSIDDVALNEGGVASFTVSLSSASEKDVSFDWATSDGTALASEDYTAGAATGVTIAAGSTTKTITVQTNDDVLDEGDETFTVTLSNAVNATLSDSSGVATLADNDATPLLSIDSISLTEGANAVFTVSLSAESGRDVMVDWTTTDNTAQSPGDFTSDLGTLTIPKGATSQTITIATHDDTIDEDTETFSVQLSNPVGTTLAAPVGTATLNDNDSMPSLSVADASANEGEVVSFIVTLSALSEKDVTFDWATSDGSAVSGQDYTGQSASGIMIPAGQLSATLNVATLEDSIDEINETFSLTLSNLGNASLGDGLATGTINDDDAAPGLSISDVTVTEGADVSFTVTLSAASEKDVTFDWATSDGTAVSPGDYSGASGTGRTIAAGDTSTVIVINTNDDVVDEPAETFDLNLTNAANATITDGVGVATLNDNDATPTLSVNDVTVTEGGDVHFTVTLSAASDRDVTFNWTTTDNTAVAGVDYTAESGTGVTITAGDTTTILTIATSTDLLDEDAETFHVLLSAPTNATIADGTGVATINDSNGAPDLSISDVTVAEGATASFTVSLSAASGQDVTFDWTTNDVSAKAGVDYTAASGTGTIIPAGSTSVTLSVDALQDAIDESNETFQVQISNVTSANLLDNVGVGTITDDDPAPTLSINDVADTEGSSISFTVTLSTASEKNVTFDWATSDGTAISPGDYSGASGTGRTIAAGDTSTVIVINTNDDDVDEPAETFNLTLANAANATIADGTGVGTLNDNDATPTLSVNDVTVTEGGDVQFTVTLSAASDRDITFDWATSDNSATAGSDYTATSGSDVTIAAGDTTKTLTITTNDDSIDEDAETFNVTLSDPVNATIADGNGIATLNDNDSAPTLSINDVSVTEAGDLDFTVSLSTTSEKDVSFDWTTVNGTAIAGSDYTANSGTGVTIPAGSPSVVLSVNTTDDTTFEANETLQVVLSNASNATISDGTGIGTINDDDAAPSLTVNDVTVTEGADVSFTVTLSAVSEKAVTFDWATSDGTAQSPGDYTGASGTGRTIAAGDTTSTIVIETVDDAVDEPAETFNLTLTNAANATITDGVGVATLNDNDATPTLSVNDVTVTEGGDAQFTVTLSAASGQDVTFNWTTSDDTAVAGSDYTVGSGTGVTITAGDTSKTLTVATTDDSIDEDAETFNVTLSGAVNATIADGSGVATLNDNDSAPALTINDVAIAEGGDLEFTVSLSTASEKDVSFDWTTVNGTAIAGTDYSSNSGTGVTIPAGSTSTVLTVNTIDDAIDEDDETLQVQISNATNASILDNAGVGTIGDNDNSPALSINDVTLAEGAVFSFTVTLSAASEKDVTFDWVTASDSAVAPADFTSNSGTSVTIAAGDTTATLNVSTNDDNTFEISEEFEVTISNATNASISRATGIGTLTDNDPAPTLSINDVTVTEGSLATFTVTLSGSTEVDASVNWSTSDTSAHAPDDYESASGSLTIVAGDSTGTFTVSTVDDSTDEASEGFSVTLSGPSNATIADGTGVGTITDNDDPPALSINDVSITEGGTATFTVSLSEPSEKNVSFNWSTTDNTASSPDDYASASGTGVTIPAGDTNVTISVTTVDDSIDEDDENFYVNISTPVNATIVDNTGIGTLIDNESLPTLSISNESELEGATATFTVTLSSVSEKDISVAWTTVDGTAKAASGDYTANSGVLHFPAGNLTKTIDVITLDNAKFEGDEQYTVQLSAPVNATISDGSGQGTIIENDAKPTLAIDDISLTEGGTAVFTVTLTGSTDLDTTFEWSTSDGTAVNPEDYSASAVSATIVAGASSTTLSVTTIDDSIDEPDQVFTVTLSNAANATFADPTGTATIIDNDAAPTISVDDVTVTEGGTATFTASLSAASQKLVSFDWSSADGTAVSPADYTAASGVGLTIPVGSTSVTFDVETNDDTRDEHSEEFTVSLANVSNATVLDGTGVGTITDNDATPTLSVNDQTITEGGTATFTVTLSAVSALDVTFDWVTSDGSAVNGTDYTAASGNALTIPAGQTTETFEVESLGDSTYEVQETFNVVLSNAVNATVADGTGVGTINDDDPRPTIAIDDVTVTEGNVVSFTVTKTGSTDVDLTFNWATSDGSATAGSDYTADSENGVIIAADETTATIVINTIDDSTDEDTETFNLTLSSATHATISDNVGIGTINDNDNSTILSINSVSATEGNNLTFTVSLNQASGFDVSFDYATSDNGATAPADYSSTSGTRTINSGSTTTTIVVPTVDDSVTCEIGEAVTVTISNPVNASIGSNVGTGTINDNDPVLNIANTSVTEGGTATFTVNMSDTCSATVTFDWATSDETALAGSDYVAASGTGTILSGDTSTTFDVAVNDDSLAEHSETFRATISNPINARIGTAMRTATIIDNDTGPNISVGDVAITEGSIATFTVSLDAPAGADIDIDWATSDGTAEAGSDYTANSGTLTIDAGDTSGTVTVNTTNDALDEDAETFTLTLSNPSLGTITDATGVATINDNDAAPSIVIDDVTVVEGVDVVFTVSLSAVSGKDVTFDWATSDGTAEAGSDYSAGSGSNVVISAGSSSRTLTIATTDDSLAESTENFTVTLSNVANASVSDGTGVATLTDNDAPPTLSINDVTITEGAGATFTISLSATAGAPVTVNWATADNTAQAGSDYTADSGVATILVGSTSTTITVNTTDDSKDEPTESFFVNLSNPTVATLSDAQGVATLNDNDAAPTLSVNDPTVTEGGNLSFTVTLSAASEQDVTFDWTTSDGTAVAGSDYTANSGTATTISAGDTTATLVVVTLDDSVHEASETVTLTLSNPTNATISDGTGSGTINDNDTAPTLSINDVTATEGNNLVFTVTLSAESEQDVTFNWSTNDVTAEAGSDYTAGSGTGVTIAAGDTSTTITVLTIDDAVDEPAQTLEVTLAGATNATISDATGVGTLNDNDAAPTLSINDVSATEGGNLVFTVTQSAVSEFATSFNWATSDGTATAGSDYTANSGTGTTIDAGDTTATLVIVTSDDSIHEASETMTVTLSSPTNVTLSDHIGIGTINDNETAPTLSINDVMVTEGSDLVFTVTLSAASGQNVTFNWSTSDVTAEAGSDYTAGSGTGVTIAAGSTSTTITVLTIDDAIDEPSQTLEVTLAGATNATISDATGVGTITDNDLPPSLSINDVAAAEGGNLVFTVTQSSVSEYTTTFNWTTSNGTATAGSDYTADSGTGVSIAVGDTTATITVVTTDDSLNEANETLNVTLSGASGATISDAVGVGTINDNDALPNISIDDVLVTEGGVAGFTVSLDQASGQTVTFDWATANSTAVAGSDYTSGAATGVSFTPGQTSKTISITTLDDSLDEDSEEFQVVLSNASNANIVDNIGLGVINDNDATPTLSVNDVAVTEGGTATFTVTLSAVSGRDVTFDWSTSDDSAIAGSDYTAASGDDVLIPAGSSSKTFSVVTTDDSTPEAAETFQVLLSDAKNATIADGTGVGTINDNEVLPTLSISDVTVTEGADLVFTVTLSASSGMNVQVDWATSDSVAVAPGDYVSASGTLTFSGGSTSETITITSNDDNVFETSVPETFVVTLSNPVGASITDGTGIGSLTDNEPIRLNGPLASNGDVSTYRISPDSAVVVYISDEDTDGINELYAVNVDGSNRTQLNSALVAGGNVVDFAIAPNSNFVVYRADQDSDEVFELYAVDISGGVPTKLNTDLTGPRSITDFAITKNSAKVVFIGDMDVSGVFELYSVNIDGTGETQLSVEPVLGGSVAEFRVAQDSSTVVYLGDMSVDEDRELYSVRTDGTSHTALNVAPTGDIYDFQISKNSTKIVYIADDDVDDVWELYSVDIDGTNPVKISGALTGSGDVHSFQISDDSSRVVYLADQDTDGQNALYSVGIGGGAVSSLTSALVADGDVMEYSISGDSSKVVYLADGSTDEIFELTVVNMNGTGATQLNGALVLGGDVLDFVVSPDSTFVTYIADQDVNGVNELYTVAIDGTGRSKLSADLPNGGDVHSVQISGDSARVIYLGDQVVDEDRELFAAGPL